MQQETENKNSGSVAEQALRQYSPLQTLANNIPYVGMILLGAVVLLTALSPAVLSWISAGVYLVYGVMGTLWIILFICPYCRYWGKRSCPCGYGKIAAYLREYKGVDCFSEKFKKHIPVIVPLWFIPLLVGVAFVVWSFSWLLLALLLIFAVDAFLILPVFSARHGCKECPQRDMCPWMAHKRGPAGK
jgi:hypothetical protein